MALAVGVGGGGAIARHAVGERLAALALDTLAVNVVGSFLLGVVLTAPVGGAVEQAAGAGFCGAFTTFSSFAVETVWLAEEGRHRDAAVVAVGTLALAVPAVRVGLALGGVVSG
jgi:CrcB protein